MKVLLANPHGFCAGVVMAVRCVEQALDLLGPPIYVYHEIVHNKHVVDRLRARGVSFVEDVDEAPPGSCLIFSAHGVSPEVRRRARERGLRTIDATCPLVSKVHLETIRFARHGYAIVLIGHKGHDEVAGTLGEAPDRIRVVESVADVDDLPPPAEGKIAYVTQTTLSIDDATRIVERLKQRFPGIVGPPSEDICFATQNRQDAMKTLLPEADVTVVIGSKNSSNSNRLAEIAAAGRKPAHLVEGAAEIDPAWFRGNETVLVTAGASVPEHIVFECLERLASQFHAVVEPRTLREENARFPLPIELRGVPMTPLVPR